MAKPKVILFDVNETLLDLTAVKESVRHFGLWTQSRPGARRKSARNSDSGDTPVTIKWSRARVQAT